MKVLFQNRFDAFHQWGGDTTQMMETKYCLEKLGVTVEVDLGTEPDLSDYDLVHIFNIQLANYSILQVKNAKRQSKPIVLSPIYWDLRHVWTSRGPYLYHKNPIIRWLAHIKGLHLLLMASASFYKNNFIHHLAKRMLQEADILLPNSYSELEIICQLFSMPELRGKSYMVPNGISTNKLNFSSNSLPHQLMSMGCDRQYVLEVGRLEFLKGQLQLIHALYHNPEIPLVFVGRGIDKPYGQECIKVAKRRGNTYFINEVEHSEIYKFYSSAKVHALPSLRESPGLATLEAAACGATCVVSIHAPITEYFGMDAFPCNPLDEDSIRGAVLAAWNAENSTNRLKDKVLNSFTWEHAAARTMDAYIKVMSSFNIS